MDKDKNTLNIIRLIREISKYNIQNLELEYDGIRIKLSNASLSVPKDEIKQTEIVDEKQEEDMIKLEEKTISERVIEKDESLLYDLDYIAPEVAGELLRSNIIKIDSNGNYKYIEEERLDA